MYIIIMQHQVAITTNFQVLTHCMSFKLCSRWQMSVQSFVSMYHTYSMSNDNILMNICQV